MPGDEVQEEAVTSAHDASDDSRGRIGPRHAAPRKPLLNRLNMPAGKAIALAAMPSAVLMGMGFTPQLASAKTLPKNPFKGDSCVSQADRDQAAEEEKAQQEAKEKAAREKAEREKAEKEKEKDKPSPSPSTPDKPSPSPSDPSGGTGGGTGSESPSPSPSDPEEDEDDDGLLGGVGDAIGDVLGGGDKDEEKKEEEKPADEATPSPSASSPSADESKATKPVEDTVGKVGDGVKDTTDKLGETTEKLGDAVGETGKKVKDTVPAAGAADGIGVGKDGKGFPCVEEKKSEGKDEQTPNVLPNDPWRLEASSLSLHGLDYKGVVNVRTQDGGTKQALKFTADSLDIGDLHQIVKGPDGTEYHVQAAKGSTSTIKGGQVTMYTERLKGNLFGLIPIVFDPEHPPPINVPEAYFTNVEVSQAGQFGGNLTVPGLKQTVQ